MFIQEITGLAEKLYLMMEVDTFLELLPGIPLVPAEKNDSALERDAAGSNRVFGNHRIASDNGGADHPLTKAYHRFLTLGLYSNNMRRVERFLNWFFPKSVVLYGVKK